MLLLTIYIIHLYVTTYYLYNLYSHIDERSPTSFKHKSVDTPALVCVQKQQQTKEYSTV